LPFCHSRAGSYTPFSNFAFLPTTPPMSTDMHCLDCQTALLFYTSCLCLSSASLLSLSRLRTSSEGKKLERLQRCGLFHNRKNEEVFPLFYRHPSPTTLHLVDDLQSRFVDIFLSFRG
jgi:hypothetical protein